MRGDAVIVQAAVTGSLVDRSTNPNVPIATDEIVRASLDAWRAGASIIHLHAREEDGTPTQDVERFRPVVDELREAGCEAVLNLSTGSAGGRVGGVPKRWECLELDPEMASFDCGSLNFGEWLFENPLPFLRDMARAIRERRVKPEIECFEIGHVHTALRLREERLLDDPLHFQFVLGVPGGSPGTVDAALYMRSLIPPDATWSICGIGRAQLPMNMLCLMHGGHLRTGLEDNSYYHRGRYAESNAQLVERLVRIADEVGRPVATPEEARAILGLPTRFETTRATGENQVRA
jgi:3-keto-5-aminohexanoate cleavage enzyme